MSAHPISKTLSVDSIFGDGECGYCYLDLKSKALENNCERNNRRPVCKQCREILAAVIFVKGKAPRKLAQFLLDSPRGPKRMQTVVDKLDLAV